MSAEIKLLYFDGCPNVEQARENLKKALQGRDAGQKSWVEVDMNDPQTPREWRGFPSPTVMINGFNVDTGERCAGGSGACRLGGAPGPEVLREGFLRYG